MTRISSCITIVSINKHKVGDLAQTIRDAEKFDPDVLCIQEIQYASIKRPININTFNDDRELRKANQVLNTDASLITITSQVGMIIFNHDFKILESIVEDRFIRTTVEIHRRDIEFPPRPSNNKQSHRLILFSVYAPADYIARRTFFEEDILNLSKLVLDENTSVILAGDFNDFNSHSLDRDPPSSRATDMFDTRSWNRYFAPILETKNIVDLFRELYPDKRDFSRTDKKYGTSSRIDAILGSYDLIDAISEVTYIPYEKSDHSFVVASFRVAKVDTEITERPKGPWRLHPNICYMFYFEETMKDRVNELLRLESYQGPFTWTKWENLKAHLLQYTKKYSYKFGHTNKNPQKQIQKLKEEVQQLEENQNTHEPGIPEKQPKYTHIQINLKRDRIQQLRLMLKSDQEREIGYPLQWDQVSEEPRIRKRRQNIVQLKDSNENMEDTMSSNTLGIIETFYQRLYTPQEPAEPNLRRNFLRSTITRTITENQNYHLTLPFTENEALAALKKSGNGKAAGYDGACYELYRILTNIILTPFAEACTSTMTTNEILPKYPPWPILKGILLHKKNDKTDIRNYRPLSLMDTDLRWRERLLLRRMVDPTETVISPEQTGFLPKRRMIDNVTALMLTIEQSKYSPDGLVILSLDQEKAYDRVSWCWLFETMQAMGFPANFIKAIKFTYQAPAVQFLNNNQRTRPILYKCGILQGGPLSVLLYILALQPLINAMNKEDLSTTVQFENDTANIPTMAYADDILVIIASLEAYYKLQKILEEFCKISNARFNETKTTAIMLPTFSTENGQPQAPPPWYDIIKESPYPMNKDYTHLGCVLRLDGTVPQESLDKLLNSLRSLCHQWRTRKLNFKARISTTNSHILSTIWHAVQLCPLPENFHSEVNRIVSNFVFNTESAPIEFELICRPTHMGGLGIIHPRSMTLAMSGATIARAFSDQSPIAKAFKLSFLRELHRVDACFFRLLSEGRFHKINRMTPYWHRIYRTILELDLSVDTDWNKYSDEQILRLPIITSATIPPALIKEAMVKRIRPGLFGVRMFLLRDILVWKRNDQPLEFISPEDGIKRTFSRCESLYKHELYKDGKYIGRYCNRHIQGRTALSDLRSLWPKILQNFPEALKTRLKAIIHRPVPGEPLYPMVFPGIDFDVSKTEDLIPWLFLTLAGKKCSNYEIKRARTYKQNDKVIIPSWITGQEIRLGLNINDRDNTKIWIGAWKALNWKNRPPKHYEAYWKLLHKRAPRFKPKPQETEQEEASRPEIERNWHLRICELCNKKDDHKHAYFECPDVQDIWQYGLKILAEILGKPAIANYNNTFTSILLAFHQVRRQLPKPLRVRVLLWHSAMINLISSKRDLAILNYDGETNKVRVEYHSTPWKEELYESLQSMMRNICQDYKSKLCKRTGEDPTGKAWENIFYRNWTKGCTLWTIQDGQLVFQNNQATTQ